MKAGLAGWLLIFAGSLGSAALSCSSGSDHGPASGGAPSGGSTSSAGGASAGGKSGSGTSGSAGNLGGTVDCGAVCGQVKVLCAENSAISDVWLSACQSACDARVQLTPDVAELERSCVAAAANCDAAVMCVAAPH